VKHPSGDQIRREAAMEFVLKGLESGALEPVIDRTFKFDDILDVHCHRAPARPMADC
jgi:NADPH:quinone reductase-like Zn-dependent oxidoreductase